jgi:tRNA(fMet)-specific endonuclease VapC
MRLFLLDTNMAGKFINRRDGVYERATAEADKGNRVGICHPVLAELAFGVECSALRERNLQRLRQALAAWKLWPVTQEAAFEYGRIAAELRRAGRAIQQNDIMIAAIARTLGNCTVVTTDRDFQAIPDLTVENWAATLAGGTA